MLTSSILLAAALAQAPTAARPTLTLDGAHRVVDAIAAEARRLHVGGAVAVVDDGGNLLLLERRDGTFAASSTVAAGKSRTSALFRKPTRDFEQVIAKGRFALTALPDFTPLQGGVPLLVDGTVVGAVGVSGASSAQQDDDFAVLGA